MHAHINMVRSCEHKCEPLNNNITITTLWDVLTHIFSPFNIQHTKSPKNLTRTYALDHMSKVQRLLHLTTSLGSSFADCVASVGRCPKLSDCRTVDLSDTVFDSLTLFDTTYRSSLSETVSDSCRTAVGLSDCRTVGSVGMSD